MYWAADSSVFCNDRQSWEEKCDTVTLSENDVSSQFWNPWKLSPLHPRRWSCLWKRRSWNPWYCLMMTARQWGMSKLLSEMTCSRDTQNLVFRAPLSLLHWFSHWPESLWSSHHRDCEHWTTGTIYISLLTMFLINYLHTYVFILIFLTLWVHLDVVFFIICCVLLYFMCLCMTFLCVINTNLL